MFAVSAFVSAVSAAVFAAMAAASLAAADVWLAAAAAASTNKSHFPISEFEDNGVEPEEVWAVLAR